MPDPITGVVGGSAVLGIGSAAMSSKAQKDAAKSAAKSADAATQVAADQLEFQKSSLAPYSKIGAQGLAQIYGTNVDYTDPITGETSVISGSGGDFNLMQDPYTGQIMQMPNYDKEYTQGLAGYQEDPGTKAQRALDAKRLAQQEQQRVGYSTPGASAARAAELGQKYDVSGYDKFKSQLADRYKALQGEFAAKRAMTADRYDQLTQKMNLGLGATKQLGSAGQNFAGQALQGAQQSGAAQMAAGQAEGGFWSGLGGAAISSANLGVNVARSGLGSGWFGNPVGGGTDQLTRGASGYTYNDPSAVGPFQ